MTDLAAAVIMLAAVFAGVAVAAAVSCIPGFHIYNLMGFMLLGVLAMRDAGLSIAPEWIVPAAAAMITTFALLNAIPSILLSAPDESVFLTVGPGRQFLDDGRAHEAMMLTAAGGFGAACLLTPAALWLLPRHAPRWHAILGPHHHWILWSVIVFMLMSEWPRGGTRGPGGWRKWLNGWRSTGAGWLTFILAGLFGFILLYRSPIPAERAFQNLMPAFVGLFALPGLLLNCWADAQPAPQTVSDRLAIAPQTLLGGVVSGSLGGAMAAFFPGITAGVGGFLAGHASAQRDDRLFLVSQGAAKLVYYAGALLLFFIPGLHLTRSGAWLLRGIINPMEHNLLPMAVASVALAAAMAFLLADGLTRNLVQRLDRIDYRRLSLAAMALMVIMVTAMTGIGGLGIAATGTAIGLIPPLFGARRMNCLSVLLLPLACNLSGFGPRIAALLGLA